MSNKTSNESWQVISSLKDFIPRFLREQTFIYFKHVHKESYPLVNVKIQHEVALHITWTPACCLRDSDKRNNNNFFVSDYL